MLRSLIVLVGIGIVACDSPTAPTDANAPIQMSAPSFSLAHGNGVYQGQLIFNYVNPRPDTLYIVNCLGGYDWLLYKWQNNGWVQAYAPVNLDCLTNPIEIAPGKTFTDTLGIYATEPGSNAYPQFTVGNVEGFYRLEIHSAFTWYDKARMMWRDSVAFKERVSNTFELKVH